MNTVINLTIEQSTRDYEAWLATHIPVLPADLAAKHEHMAADAFSFLRATCYRWAQLFPAICPELSATPTVLSVGDLHVENYGTWRDAEGRLVWGINDFDEAFPLPYANDLVRLATSAELAIRLNHLSLGSAAACAHILEGYTTGLDEGVRAFVLSERNHWLRDTVTGRLRDPEHFWKKLAALPTIKRVPDEVMSLLKRALPKDVQSFCVAHRQAGLGSLGRPRFTAIAEWHNGKIAREAKALLPSAWVWAGAPTKNGRIYYEEIVRRAARAEDPFLKVNGTWVVRRLSPFCSRLELDQLSREHDQEKLLRAMGYELANVHHGTRGAAVRVSSDLKRRKADWLVRAADLMAQATLDDWQAWRKKARSKQPPSAV